MTLEVIVCPIVTSYKFKPTYAGFYFKIKCNKRIESLLIIG
jgi:hypothetical protein